MLSNVCASDTTIFGYLFQWGPLVFSFLLVVVGALQAKWLMLTWQAIQKQITAQRTSERAWVIISPEHWTPTLVFNQNVFEVSIKNVGRTPAHLTKLAHRYIKLDKTQLENLSKEPDYGPIESLGSVILVPEDSLSATAPLEPSPMLTNQDIQSIHNSQSFLYFYAYIEYRDAFGENHETRVGLVYPFPQPALMTYGPRIFQRSGPPSYNRAT